MILDRIISLTLVCVFLYQGQLSCWGRMFVNIGSNLPFCSNCVL